MKIVVCGSRVWDDEPTIKARLRLVPNYWEATLIHGGCSGADSLAAHAAFALGFRSIHEFPADWTRFGLSAGPIRNGFMLDEHPDLVIAFHDDYDHSKGTRYTVEEARRRGIPVEMISHGSPTPPAERNRG